MAPLAERLVVSLLRDELLTAKDAKDAREIRRSKNAY